MEDMDTPVEQESHERNIRKMFSCGTEIQYGEKNDVTGSQMVQDRGLSNGKTTLKYTYTSKADFCSCILGCRKNSDEKVFTAIFDPHLS